jgi:hypothetical protein
MLTVFIAIFIKYSVIELDLKWANLEGASDFDEFLFLIEFLFNKIFFGFIVFKGGFGFIVIIKLIIFRFVIYIF